VAYPEGGEMVGPDGDPSGWKILEDAKLTGTLFKNRAIEIRYKLAIGLPVGD